MSTSQATKTEFQFNEKWIEHIRKNFTSPFKFRLTLMARLPLGFLAGMRIREMTRERCVTTVRYKWLNRNPFRSVFWAVLGMTAEMACGAMVLMYTFRQKPSFATIVVRQEGRFLKKAVGKTTFVFESGKAIAAAVEESALTGEGVEIECPITGYNEDGEVIAEFLFVWSVKARLKK